MEENLERRLKAVDQRAQQVAAQRRHYDATAMPPPQGLVPDANSLIGGGPSALSIAMSGNKPLSSSPPRTSSTGRGGGNASSSVLGPTVSGGGPPVNGAPGADPSIAGLPGCPRCQSMDVSINILRTNVASVEEGYLDQIESLTETLNVVEAERDDLLKRSTMYHHEAELQHANSLKRASEVSSLRRDLVRLETENETLRRQLMHAQTQLSHQTKFSLERESLQLANEEASSRSSIGLMEQCWWEVTLATWNAQRAAEKRLELQIKQLNLKARLTQGGGGNSAQFKPPAPLSDLNFNLGGSGMTPVQTGLVGAIGDDQVIIEQPRSPTMGSYVQEEFQAVGRSMAELTVGGGGGFHGEGGLSGVWGGAGGPGTEELQAELEEVDKKLNRALASELKAKKELTLAKHEMTQLNDRCNMSTRELLSQCENNQRMDMFTTYLTQITNLYSDRHRSLYDAGEKQRRFQQLETAGKDKEISTLRRLLMDEKDNSKKQQTLADSYKKQLEDSKKKMNDLVRQNQVMMEQSHGSMSTSTNPLLEGNVYVTGMNAMGEKQQQQQATHRGSIEISVDGGPPDAFTSTAPPDGDPGFTLNRTQDDISEEEFFVGRATQRVPDSSSEEDDSEDGSPTMRGSASTRRGTFNSTIASDDSDAPIPRSSKNLKQQQRPRADSSSSSDGAEVGQLSGSAKMTQAEILKAKQQEFLAKRAQRKEKEAMSQSTSSNGGGDLLILGRPNPAIIGGGGGFSGSNVAPPGSTPPDGPLASLLDPPPKSIQQTTNNRSMTNTPPAAVAHNKKAVKLRDSGAQTTLAGVELIHHLQQQILGVSIPAAGGPVSDGKGRLSFSFSSGGPETPPAALDRGDPMSSFREAQQQAKNSSASPAAGVNPPAAELDEATKKRITEIHASVEELKVDFQIILNKISGETSVLVDSVNDSVGSAREDFASLMSEFSDLKKVLDDLKSINNNTSSNAFNMSSVSNEGAGLNGSASNKSVADDIGLLKTTLKNLLVSVSHHQQKVHHSVKSVSQTLTGIHDDLQNVRADQQDVTSGVRNLDASLLRAVERQMSIERVSAPTKEGGPLSTTSSTTGGGGGNVNNNVSVTSSGSNASPILKLNEPGAFPPADQTSNLLSVQSRSQMGTAAGKSVTINDGGNIISPNSATAPPSATAAGSGGDAFASSVKSTASKHDWDDSDEDDDIEIPKRAPAPPAASAIASSTGAKKFTITPFDDEDD